LRAEGIDLLPENLSDAIDALEQDPVVLGALGSPYGEYYVQMKREEWKAYHDSVSQWEVDRYLGQF